MTDLVVIGAGITGLAAAWEAHRRGASVTVLDAADTPGGKLRTSPVAGLPVDESADAFLVRRPEAVGLCKELGLEDELVAPATGQAYIWANSALRPLPKDQLLGIPTDLDAVATSGILSPAGLARAAQDLERTTSAPATSGESLPQDETVGAIVRDHLGDEVHDLLVAPLVGGIWAGDSDLLSAEVAAPAIAEARRQDPSLIRGAQALRATATGAAPESPVFLALRGGMARLIEALADRMGSRLQLACPVEALKPDGSAGNRWRVEPAGISAGAVVVTTPAPVTSHLLGPHSPRAANALEGIEHASVALVTLAVPRGSVDHPLDGSGFLVPAPAGLLITACSWASSKWAHLAGDGSTLVLRVSAGRHGDSRALALTDGELLTAVLADLKQTMGLTATPLDTRINRWHQAFPQPRPGHLERVARLETDLAADAPGLAAAGAWSRGVGIPACIGGGRTAAAAVLG